MHPAPVGPADIHLGERRRELFGPAFRSPSPARTAHMEEHLSRSVVLDPAQCTVEDVQAPGEQPDELCIRPTVGSHAAAQACAEPFGSARGGLEAVEVLGLCQELEAVVAVPEAGLGNGRQRVALARLRLLDVVREALELCEQEANQLLASARRARDTGELERSQCLFFVRDRGLGVGSTNTTSIRSADGAVTKRNWSPSGTDCSTMAAASGASRCCSTARLSGRAPSSGLKPFSMRKVYADSSTSTAHGRPRSPRRARASASSLSSRARIAERSNGLNTTIRSKRSGARDEKRSERRARCRRSRTCDPPDRSRLDLLPARAEIRCST
jgi:hypothetical protein